MLGVALVQADADFGPGLAQAGDGLGQHVARLGVGGGDGEGAGVLRGVFLADAFEVVHLAQDDGNAFQHVAARFGDAFEAFAVAGEDVDAQLLLKVDDGLGNAGLRGVQNARGFGEVEVAARGFLDETELVQVHGVKGSGAGVEGAGKSRAGQGVEHGGVFGDGGRLRDGHARMGVAQRGQQARQIFAGVAAHA